MNDNGSYISLEMQILLDRRANLHLQFGAQVRKDENGRPLHMPEALGPFYDQVRNYSPRTAENYADRIKRCRGDINKLRQEPFLYDVKTDHLAVVADLARQALEWRAYGPKLQLDAEIKLQQEFDEARRQRMLSPVSSDQNTDATDDCSSEVEIDIDYDQIMLALKTLGLDERATCEIATRRIQKLQREIEHGIVARGPYWEKRGGYANAVNIATKILFDAAQVGAFPLPRLKDLAPDQVRWVDCVG